MSCRSIINRNTRGLVQVWVVLGQDQATAELPTPDFCLEPNGTSGLMYAGVRLSTFF